MFKKLLAITAVVIFFSLFASLAMAKNLNRAMITLTFDDGERSVCEQALPILSQYNIPATAYIVPDWIGDSTHLAWSQLWSLNWKYGWEIGNHSYSHQHLLSLNDDQIRAEVKGAQDAFLEHGLLGQGAFAPPYGEFDDRLVGILKQVGFTTSSRQAWTEDSALNDPASFNEWAINVVSLRKSTAYANIKLLIDQAVAEKKWLAFVIHGVKPVPVDENEISTSTLNKIAQYINYKRSLSQLDPATLSRGVGKMLYYKNLP